MFLSLEILPGFENLINRLQKVYTKADVQHTFWRPPLFFDELVRTGAVPVGGSDYQYPEVFRVPLLLPRLREPETRRAAEPRS